MLHPLDSGLEYFHHPISTFSIILEASSIMSSMIGTVLPLVLINWVRDSVDTKRVKVFSALSSDHQKVLQYYPF